MAATQFGERPLLPSLPLPPSPKLALDLFPPLGSPSSHRGLGPVPLSLRSREKRFEAVLGSMFSFFFSPRVRDEMVSLLTALPHPHSLTTSSFAGQQECPRSAPGHHTRRTFPLLCQSTRHLPFSQRFFLRSHGFPPDRTTPQRFVVFLRHGRGNPLAIHRQRGFFGSLFLPCTPLHITRGGPFPFVESFFLKLRFPSPFAIAGLLNVLFEVGSPPPKSRRSEFLFLLYFFDDDLSSSRQIL